MSDASKGHRAGPTPPESKKLKAALDAIDKFWGVPVQEGGAGSGNFGHAGRPGEIGGSGAGEHGKERNLSDPMSSEHKSGLARAGTYIWVGKPYNAGEGTWTQEVKFNQKNYTVETNAKAGLTTINKSGDWENKEVFDSPDEAYEWIEKQVTSQFNADAAKFAKEHPGVNAKFAADATKWAKENPEKYDQVNADAARWGSDRKK